MRDKTFFTTLGIYLLLLSLKIIRNLLDLTKKIADISVAWIPKTRYFETVTKLKCFNVLNVSFLIKKLRKFNKSGIHVYQFRRKSEEEQ